ncbi:MAG TPA: aminotransferase class I/II-fold pyridoxal phosphate-dependent enzyme, partial [candidate division Zixibacteria bacterium]|nr:aminotransferase class I/II-fold pyridoxal phosphate-dependent enzyme [candidate division Zixibacteria bacterium]
MRLSSRAYEVPPSPIRKLVPFAEEAKRRGLYVYHINIGQPDIETPQSFWNAVHSYPAKVLEYGNSKGLPEYRKYLAKYYQDNGIDVDPEHLIVTTGGSEAIMFAMLAVTDPGDNIIVFEPFYTNYNGYAVMTDIQLKPVTTKPETGYHLPPEEEIEAKIDERTRAILVCSPNNPTGTVLTEEELKTIAR